MNFLPAQHSKLHDRAGEAQREKGGGGVSITYSEEVILVSQVCISCGVTFAMPSGFEAQRRKDHGNFYCPNGHAQMYVSKSDEEILREKLVRQEAETRYQRENFFAEQRRHEETQRSLKRLKKRTAAGTCPCCKRTFSQLARHMQSKHVEFVKENGIPVVAEKCA